MSTLVVSCQPRTEDLGKTLAEHLGKAFKPQQIVLSSKTWEPPGAYEFATYAKSIHLLLIGEEDVDLPWVHFLAGFGWARDRRLVWLLKTGSLRRRLPFPPQVGTRLGLDEPGWARELLKVIGEKLFLYSRPGFSLEQFEGAVTGALSAKTVEPETIPVVAVPGKLPHPEGQERRKPGLAPKKRSDTSNRKEDNELFPLFGVSLGRTTTEELAALGERANNKDSDTGDFYTYFRVKGFKFWYQNGVANHMYLTRYEKLPEPWRKLGFDWGLSYVDWMELLQNRGYDISVTGPPRVEEQKGHQCFSASLRTLVPGNKPIMMELDFRYADGTSDVDDPDTLYSLRLSLA